MFGAPCENPHGAVLNVTVTGLNAQGQQVIVSDTFDLDGCDGSYELGSGS